MEQRSPSIESFQGSSKGNIPAARSGEDNQGTARFNDMRPEKGSQLQLKSIIQKRSKDSAAANLSLSSNPGVIQRVGKAVAENVKDRKISDVKATIDTATKDNQYGANLPANLMVGFGDAAGGNKWRTQVKWSNATPPNLLRGITVNEYGEDGTGMTANPLGPDHPMGSSPSGGTTTNSGLATAQTGNKYIAGHLLNDNLGGPGDDIRNITAIPEDVNKAHSASVETPIKTEVNVRGHWVYYRVTIAHADGNTKLATKMDTYWHLFNDNGTQHGPLHHNSFNLKTAVHTPSLPDNAGHNVGTIAKTNDMNIYGDVRPLISSKDYPGGASKAPGMYPHIGARSKNIRHDVELRWDRLTHPIPANRQALYLGETPLPLNWQTSKSRSLKTNWVSQETIRQTNAIRNSFVDRWKGVGRDREGSDNPFLYGDAGK